VFTVPPRMRPGTSTSAYIYYRRSSNATMGLRVCVVKGSQRETRLRLRSLMPFGFLRVEPQPAFRAFDFFPTDAIDLCGRDLVSAPRAGSVQRGEYLLHVDFLSGGHGCNSSP